MTLSNQQRKLLFAVPFVVIVIAALIIGLVALSRSSAKPANGGVPSQVNLDPEGYSLEHVTIVHRHAIRAPTHLSNWSNPEDYPMGLGFLTTKGKQDSILAGKIFRHFYQHFLTDSPREVWARSSTYKRCFETEQLLLGAMYPPRGMWDFGYPTQPIPITMVPDGNDVLIESCTAEILPNFEYMVNETHKALQTDGFPTVGDFLKWVNKVSGFPANTSEFYPPIIDGLYAQKFNHLSLPDWAKEKDASMDWAMRRLSYDYWVNFIPYYGQYIGKLITERTQKATKDPVKERVSIMSYHDTTIQAIMSAVKLDYVELYPSFLAAMHFQLYKRILDGERFVRVMYHQGFTADGDYREAVELKLPNCTFPDCPVEKFVSLMDDLYPNTNRSECNPVDRKALL